MLVGLGADGKPVVAALKKVLTRYGGFDTKRIGREGKALEATIRDAISPWEAKCGKA